MRRHLLATALTFALSLVTAGGAQAVVIDMNAVGQATVPYSSSNQGGYYGVSMSTAVANNGALGANHVPVVTGAPASCDPMLARQYTDLAMQAGGLCWHGGAVMHTNESFALTWDPNRLYWSTTRNYLEQFLRDVADGSGGNGSPYAVTPQYTDQAADSLFGNPFGRAANSSLYGGGCVDYGSQGGASCAFANTTATGPGHNYSDFPAVGGACTPTGTNQWAETPYGGYTNAADQICITDDQIQNEVKAMLAQTQLAPAHVQPDHTPVIVVLTPPGVEVCLKSGVNLCSANAAPTTSGNVQIARFCSYHGQVAVAGVGNVSYVVQPWTPSAPWGPVDNGCDDPSIPPINPHPTVQELATDVGARLVSPLSQAHLASIVNPNFTGWFAGSGAEIYDNGCAPLANGLDSAAVGNGSYFLQREFNDGGLINIDPNALMCSGVVNLVPSFVAPSPVNPGDQVWFDGSTSPSTLAVSKFDYIWNFGDGTGLTIGPSVVHSYAKAGTYTVTLTVVDRGGNVATGTQSVVVLGPNGQPAPPATTPPPNASGPLVKIQLGLEPLRKFLRQGLTATVTSNVAADGIVTMTAKLSPRAAKRAGLKTGKYGVVVIGRGTISGLIKQGKATLHLHLSPAMAAKLARLSHFGVNVRLTLVSASGKHFASVAGANF